MTDPPDDNVIRPDFGKDKPPEIPDREPDLQGPTFSIWLTPVRHQVNGLIGDTRKLAEHSDRQNDVITEQAKTIARASVQRHRVIVGLAVLWTVTVLLFAAAILFGTSEILDDLIRYCTGGLLGGAGVLLATMPRREQ